MLRILCAVNPVRGARLLSQLRSLHDGAVRIRVVEHVDAVLVREIDHLSPDVVLYDPVCDAGGLLANGSIGGRHSPAVVCISDDPSFALMAFQLGAVHYLSYDAAFDELDCALERCRLVVSRYQPSMMLHEQSVPFSPSRDIIALPVLSGIELRDRRSIVRIQGERNYTKVVFLNDPAMLLSRTIRDYAPVLENSGMLRVHRSHLVNLVHVRRIIRGKTLRLMMCNGDEVDVSNSYREQLYAAVQLVERRAS